MRYAPKAVMVFEKMPQPFLVSKRDKNEMDKLLAMG
jgi:hypothetical protein